MAAQRLNEDDRTALRLMQMPSPYRGLPIGAWLIVAFLWIRRESFPKRNEIAAHAGCNADTATRWLRALAAVGLLHESGHHFAVNEAAVRRLLENQGKQGGPIREYRGKSLGSVPITTTTTTSTTPFSPSRASNPSESAEWRRVEPSSTRVSAAHEFVLEVVEILRFHGVLARADLDALAILKLQDKGMTLALAKEAALQCHRAASRRMRYWEGTVNRMLAAQGHTHRSTDVHGDQPMAATTHLRIVASGEAQQ